MVAVRVRRRMRLVQERVCVYLEDGERNKVEDGGEDDLNEGDNQASMDNKLSELRTALVRIAAMPEKKSPYIRKLRYGEIGGK